MEKNKKTNSIIPTTASLLALAIGGLMAGSLTSCTAAEHDSAAMSDMDGCSGADGCSGKEGCSGADGCSGKDGCGGK